MDQFGEDPLTKLAFTIQANKGVYALLLGSGISLSSGIKTGWGITCDLIARYAVGCGEKEPDFEDDQDRDLYWAKWYVDKYKKQPDYSDLLEKLGNTEAERQSIIKAYIEPSSEDIAQGKKAPTKAHHAIAKLVKDGFIKVIITTNFDRLLEQALHQVGITPTVINSTDDLLGQDPLDHSHCYLMKVHGDYKDHRIKNTIGELSEYPDEYQELLKRIFNDYGLIVCGWSAAWDIALKNTIRSASNRRYSLFWASYGELGEDASQIVEERKGNVIPTNKNKIGGADGFFTKLQEKVEQIEKLSLRRPRTEALILSTLKDYLSEPEKNRIRIDDLFKEVLTTQLLEFKKFHKNKWITRDWEDKFSICEAQTQTLAKMVGILGIYGKNGDKEVKLVCNFIQLICDKLRNKLSGEAYWEMPSNKNAYWEDNSNLSYPAHLLFTLYGVALTKAERWKELHDLLTFPLKRMYVKNLSDSTTDTPMWYFFAYSRMENKKNKTSNHNDLIKLWLNKLSIDSYTAAFTVGLFYYFTFLVNIEDKWNKLDNDAKNIITKEITDQRKVDNIVQLQNDLFNISNEWYCLTQLRLPTEATFITSMSEIRSFFNNMTLRKELVKSGFSIIQEYLLLNLLFSQ